MDSVRVKQTNRNDLSLIMIDYAILENLRMRYPITPKLLLMPISIDYLCHRPHRHHCHDRHRR